MNIIENIREGIRSIRANSLRATLTILIIAIGITSLVGILTAIDSIQSSVNKSFVNLGANVFEIKTQSGRRNRRGKTDKVQPPFSYREAVRFQEQYTYRAQVAVSARLTFAAEVKRASKKTNPNVSVYGANENYIQAKGYDLDNGRNFSEIEL